MTDVRATTPVPVGLAVPALLAWYHCHRRPMPWREHATPYRVWLSEIMLQQTQVATVVPYFERFVERFSDVFELAAASQEEVLKQWQGLGYYSRARNLHRAARELVAECGGRLPTCCREWLALPGVGAYTAAAISSIAFAEPVPVVDGNVVRVASRLWTLAGDPRRLSFRKTVGEWLQTPLAAASHPGDFNQAMMELGATRCRPRNPLCEQCPLADACMALAKAEIDSFPTTTSRPPTPHYEVAVAIIVQGERLLVAKRPENRMLGGMWELPGGKIEGGETPMQAVVRECREELGGDVVPCRALPTVAHAYSHFSVTLHPFLCSLDAPAESLVANAAAELKWIARHEIAELPFPRATLKVLELFANSASSTAPTEGNAGGGMEPFPAPAREQCPSGGLTGAR